MSPDPSISLSLPLSSVNYVLQALAQRPYGEVAGLVKSIQEQAQSQLESQAAPSEVGHKPAD